MDSITPESTTFPSDVLKWMKANAAPKMALKLMQICKYFQHQEFPYIVIEHFNADSKGFQYTERNGSAHKFKEIKDLPNNLWITNCCLTDISPGANANVISQIIPKIVVCEVKRLTLEGEDISFSDFKALTSSGFVKQLRLERSPVYDDGFRPVSFEEIVACVPAAEKIYFVSAVPSIVSVDAVRQLSLSNLKSVDLRAIYEDDFNVITFIEFMKEYKSVKYDLWFAADSLSFPYTQQLQEFVDEIIAAADLRFPPPYISFPFQNEESEIALEDLENAYCNS